MQQRIHHKLKKCCIHINSESVRNNANTTTEMCLYKIHTTTTKMWREKNHQKLCGNFCRAAATNSQINYNTRLYTSLILKAYSVVQQLLLIFTFVYICRIQDNGRF
jgi:hypothetical protein